MCNTCVRSLSFKCAEGNESPFFVFVHTCVLIARVPYMQRPVICASAPMWCLLDSHNLPSWATWASRPDSGPSFGPLGVTYAVYERRAGVSNNNAPRSTSARACPLSVWGVQANWDRISSFPFVWTYTYIHTCTVWLILCEVFFSVQIAVYAQPYTHKEKNCWDEKRSSVRGSRQLVYVFPQE